MPEPPKATAGPDVMGREIAEGPDAVEATLAHVESFRSRLDPRLASAGRIMLVATGASLATARIAAPIWRARLGSQSQLLVRQSSEAALGDLDGVKVVPHDLVIAISQSGTSPETLAAARQAREAGASVLALTANEDSPLAVASDLTLRLESGMEEGAATKSALASLAALLTMAGALDAKPANARRARDLLAAIVVESWPADAESGGLLGQARHVWLLGFGAGHGIAEAGVLLWHEKVRRPATAATPSEFRHGLVEAATRDDAVLLVDSSESELGAGAYLDRLRSELQSLRVPIVELRPQAREVGLTPLELLLRVQMLARATALAAGTYREEFAVLRHSVKPASDLFG